MTFIWDDPGEGFANRYEYRHKCQNPQVSCDNTFTTESWINAADRSSSVVADDSFSMTIPGNNSVVYFQLRAVNATPNPDLPGPVTAVTVSRSNTPGTSTPPPDAPTGFSAAAEWDDTNTQWDIVLSWTDPSDTDIDKYQYRQSTDGGGNWNPDWTDIDPSDASTVRHRINGVTASTTYTFQIRAVDTDLGDRGAGALSRSEATTPGAPNAPTLDSATATDDTTTVDVNEAETEIVLSWTAGAGITGVVVDDYEYRQFVSGDASWSAWNSISGDGSETTYTVTKLVASTTYDFQLRAKAGSLASDPSETVSAKTAVPAEGVPQPEPPTGLRATAGNEQVTLDWGHPNPGEVKWYRYRFAEGNDASSGEWQQIPGTGATMTYTVTGLENGTTYNFQVQAAGGGDDNVSAASETATATATPRRPRGGGSLPQPPSAPAGLTVTPGNGQATLAWNDPQDPSITGYVYTQTPGDPSGHRIAVPAVVDGRMTHTVTGLTNGVEYAFQLRAETAAGLGAALASVAVMPMAPLTVNFAQAEYTVGEGDETSVEVRISPAADRRVVVPLTVTHQGGATSRDYDEIPASIVFEVGATAAAVAVAALADQADDPDESIVIGFGSLPGVVSAGEPSTTTVRFLNRRRTAQFEDSLEVILEAMARSRAASAQTAVESRFERYRQLGRLRSFAATASGDGPFSGEAEAHALARADATAAPDRAWSESPLAKGLDLPGLSQVSFELLGNHGEQGQGGKSWMPTVWGQGDLQHFSDTVTAKGLDYQGRLSAAHMGLDLYTGEHVLLGVSYMHSWGDVDYTADGTDGVLEDSLDTIHPYLYWQPSERFSVWGMGGWGSGQVEVTESQGTYDFDADFRMLSGGLRSVLIKGSRTQLGLRADAFTASLETQAAQGIRRVTGTANRGRLMLELVHDRPLAAGRSLSLKVEAGGRFDRGEADEGAGAETGLRLAFLDAVSGLDLALHGRVLLVHEWQDYRDWGWGVQVSWDPGRKHRGLHLSMMSSQGHHVGGKTTLWDNSAAITRSLDTNYLAAASQTLMDGEVAYGFDTRGGGLLTPYSRMRWAGQSRELRLGTRYSLPSRSILGRSLALGLEGMRRENLTDLDNPEFALQLYLSL